MNDKISLNEVVSVSQRLATQFILSYVKSDWELVGFNINKNILSVAEEKAIKSFSNFLIVDQGNAQWRLDALRSSVDFICAAQERREYLRRKESLSAENKKTLLNLSGALKDMDETLVCIINKAEDYLIKMEKQHEVLLKMILKNETNETKVVKIKKSKKTVK